MGYNKGKDNPMFGTHKSGKDAAFYGKKHSKETKRKMSESKRGISKCVSCHQKLHRHLEAKENCA